MLSYSRLLLLLLALAAQGLQAFPLSDTTTVASSTTIATNSISSLSPSSTPSSGNITQGWTSSPNGRGTVDILWTCLITMFLCSWSVLCLQIPGEKDTRFDIFWRRCWLTALCALGPEFTLQLSLGQWSAARQSVRDFHAAGFKDWTIKHAFYANAGGFYLYTPDFKPIPMDEKQLLYLIRQGYIEYPSLSTHQIDDKNKVDVLLRILSVGQITWFTSSLIARRVQGLVITGMELTTAAFILCSLGTTYCWWNKCADVIVPEKITTTTTMTKIILDAGNASAAPYHRTPLDFISREEWHWSLYWTHWINILRRLHIVFAPKALPHDRIENTLWLDLSARGSMAAFMTMCLAYSAIFVAGWNDHFPTTIERMLWRVSSLSMMVTVILYFLITGFAFIFWPALKKYFGSQEKFADKANRSGPSSSGNTVMSLVPSTITSTLQCAEKSIKLDSSSSEHNVIDTSPPAQAQPQAPKPKSRLHAKLSCIAARIRNNSILKDPSLDVPLKATLPMYVVGFFYCSSRSLIILLDIIQLRSMPQSAYETVEWSSFIPHIG